MKKNAHLLLVAAVLVLGFQVPQAFGKDDSKSEAAPASQKRRATASIVALPDQMVSIPGGTFQMGDLTGDGAADERPVHTVSIKPFKLGKYEVTVGQFRAFVLSTDYKTAAERNISKEGCFTTDTATGKADWHAGAMWSAPGFEQTDAQPVVCVSWNDAQAFILWLNRETGKHFRLPTEAEWEYAARAGTATKYLWGDNADQGCRYGNGADQTPGPHSRPKNMDCDDGYFFTSPVGHYAANAFGLYDMTGNVWEQMQDCYNDSYAGGPNDGSAWTSGDCARRVVRGASYGNNPAALRVSQRSKQPAMNRNGALGFRLAQDP